MIRASQMADLAALLVRCGTELATPCGCGRSGCTIGEHVWRSTRDGIAGLAAQDFEPVGHGTGDTPGPSTTDRESRAHDELLTAATEARRAADRLLIITQNWSPTRPVADDTASDDQWCRWHLETIGVCQPLGASGRGGLCSWCYTFSRRHDLLPPAGLLRIHHERGRVTTTEVQAAVIAARTRRKRKRKRQR